MKTPTQKRRPHISARFVTALAATLIVGGCSKKEQTLESLLDAKIKAAECQAQQLIPGECFSLKVSVAVAKARAAEAGHDMESVNSATTISALASSSRNRPSPMEEVRASFMETTLPIEPDTAFYKLFSPKHSCQDVTPESTLYQLTAWSPSDGKMIYAFTDITSSLNASARPCISRKILANPTALITQSQLENLQRSSPRVRGLPTEYRVFATHKDVMQFYDSELVRHCLQVIPSSSRAYVEITRDEEEVENYSLVKKGSYEIKVSKPGYLIDTRVVRVDKPTQLHVDLKSGVNSVPCGKAQVRVTNVRGLSSVEGCTWQHERERYTAFERKREVSISVMNQSSQRLYGLEYREEVFDGDGVKRRNVTRRLAIHPSDSAFRRFNTTVMTLEEPEAPYRSFYVEHAVPRGGKGRFDHVIRNDIQMPGSNYTFKWTLLRYLFLKEGGYYPGSYDIPPTVLGHQRAKTACSIDM